MSGRSVGEIAFAACGPQAGVGSHPDAAVALTVSLTVSLIVALTVACIARYLAERGALSPSHVAFARRPSFPR